jgi:hypothetical protein
LAPLVFGCTAALAVVLLVVNTYSVGELCGYRYGNHKALAGGAASKAGTNPTCDRSLQSLIDAADPGAAVEAAGGCVYRETVDIDKPITLRAASGGSEIRGSDIWDAVWSQQGTRWVSSKTVPPLATESDWKCEPNTSRCEWPEQVFVDGEQLMQVASGTTPDPGQFALDAGRRVILGGSPFGRTVEVTVRNHWVVGDTGGANVTADGFTMKHAASEGISNNWNDNWTIKNGDYSYSHTSNLQLAQATGLLMLANKIHHAGQKGVAGNNSDLVLRDNEIYENNTEGYETSWNAGGVKVSNPRTVTIAGNLVYGNNGNGLWLDVPADEQVLVVKNNRVHHNGADGIRSEVTDNNVRIHENVVWENGWGCGGSNDAGISLNASHDNRVYDNVVAWNENGILVRNPLRTDVHPEEKEYDFVYNVEVDHNDILMDNRADPRSDGAYALGWLKPNSGGNLFNPMAKNRGHDNRYWYPGPEGSENRYSWGVDLPSIGAFNGTFGEERGRYLSEAEKDSVAKANGIPVSPPTQRR